MNQSNLIAKLMILLTIVGLFGGSYVLYRFVYLDDNTLQGMRVVPIPPLDLDSYSRLKNKEEVPTPAPAPQPVKP